MHALGTGTWGSKPTATMAIAKLSLLPLLSQVENGKGAMPAWEGTLDDDEIQAVAAYVYDQAAGDKW